MSNNPNSVVWGGGAKKPLNKPFKIKKIIILEKKREEST